MLAFVSQKMKTIKSSSNFSESFYFLWVHFIYTHERNNVLYPRFPILDVVFVKLSYNYPEDLMRNLFLRPKDTWEEQKIVNRQKLLTS